MCDSTLMAEPMRQRSRHRLLAAMALAGVVTLATGCLYRMPIQQGNFLDPTQVVQLQQGMTKSQVKFLLGTPMVPDGFDSDRWNYYFYEKAGKQKPFTMRLTIWFKDDKVDRFDRPANTEALAAAISAQNARAAAESAAPTVAPPRISSTPSSPTSPRQPGR
jgi:outer membrane protein assembly factor BamE